MGRWFKTMTERLADEEQRTGIATRTEFVRSAMVWRGYAQGMDGYVEDWTERGVQEALLSRLVLAPSVDNNQDGG